MAVALNWETPILLCGIILIAAGIYLILKIKKRTEKIITPLYVKPTGIVIAPPKKVEKPKKDVVRSVPLEQIVVPSNFSKEIAFYFGS